MNVYSAYNVENFGNKCPHLDGSIVFQARSLYGLKYGYNYLFAPICDSEISDTIEIQGRMMEEKDFATEYQNQTKELNVLIYPNPSKTVINITAENIANCDIEIIDQQGRVIKFVKEIKHNNLIHIAHNLDIGIYTILIDNGFEKQSKKLIVDK